MLATIYTKTIRDRRLGMSIAAAVLALFMLYAMAVYSDIDLSFYTDLPQALRDLMGIPEGADAASLSYNVMLSAIGALTLGGLAISMGAAAIAGEERNGTLGLLLANPKSRTHVLVSKITSMVTLIAAVSVVLWVAGLGIPALLDIEIGRTHVGAMMLHLGVNSLFYGFLAAAIGGWTGNRSLASGATAGVMVLSYFATGLLPLIESLADLARVFPWYYYNAGDPLVNGVNWGHLSVLIIGSAALGVVAVVGVNRRDLRGQSSGVTLLDRLRANPTTNRLVDRLAGSTRVSKLWIKTASEHQGLLIVVSLTMFAVMGVMLGPMYAAVEGDLSSLSEQLPESLLAIAGGGDMSTAEGFFQVETFSLMAPIAIMIVTIVIGARALAGEEANKTIGLLLANPIKRSTVVLNQVIPMVLYAVVVGLATFAGVAVGSIISGLGMSITGIAATSGLVTLLGLVFGALALLLSAGTGQTRIAVYGTIGVALASHLLNSFLPLSVRLAGYAKLTPNYYYLSSDPLINGMRWGHAALLAGLIVAMVAASVVVYERRDLRQQ